MKKILILLLIILCQKTFAQEKKVDQKKESQIELFSQKSGAIIKKEYINIGTVEGVKFQVLVLTDVLTNTTVKGLRMESETGGTYSITKIAFLDSDEVEGFIKSLNYCIDNVLKTTPPANDVEYNYSSRSGFTAGVFNYRNKWSGYVKLDQYGTGSQTDFSIENFEKVRDIIVQVKAQL